MQHQGPNRMSVGGRARQCHTRCLPASSAPVQCASTAAPVAHTWSGPMVVRTVTYVVGGGALIVNEWLWRKNYTLKETRKIWKERMGDILTRLDKIEQAVKEIKQKRKQK